MDEIDHHVTRTGAWRYVAVGAGAGARGGVGPEGPRILMGEAPTDNAHAGPAKAISRAGRHGIDA